MRFTANIDYWGEPQAIINFMGTEKDVYKHLSKAHQKKINREYNLSLEINVTPTKLKKVFPKEYKEYLNLIKYIEHIIRPDLKDYNNKIERYRELKRKVIISHQIQTKPNILKSAQIA